MKKLVLSLFLALMLVGSVYASCNRHTTQSPDGKGNLLIYPVYFAADGFQSRVWITNTSDNLSVVYKVVIFSPKYSIEMKDFFVYLSPHDATYFDLKAVGNDVTVETDDDSICNPYDGTQCGSNFTFTPLVKPNCDEDAYGYIVAFPAAAFNLGTSPVDKKDIVDEYNDYIKGSVTSQNVPYSVFGKLEMYNNQGDFYAVYDAYSFRIPDASQPIEVGDKTSFATVNYLDVTDFEAVLAKSRIHLANTEPAGNMIYIVNFPTKETGQCPSDPDHVMGTGPFFTESANYSTDQYGNFGISYNYVNYDMKEYTEKGPTCTQSPCGETHVPVFPYEVNFVFDEGFASMGYNYIVFPQTGGTNNFTDKAGDNVSFDGAPALPLTFIIHSNGSYGFVRPAFTHGDVTCDNGTVMMTYPDGNDFYYGWDYSAQ